MKHAKMLALAAVVAGALMAFMATGTASATVLCSTTADPCPSAQKWPVNTVLDFSIPSGKQTVLVATEGTEIDRCSTSTVKGKITNAGSVTETVTGPVEETTWGSCTFTTTTLEMGKLEVHKIAGTSNGTVTADGTFRVTVNTILFGSCIWGITSGSDLGTITEGNPAVFHLNVVAEIMSGSNFACQSTAVWTGAYTLTAPAGTTLSVSSS